MFRNGGRRSSSSRFPAAETEKEKEYAGEIYAQGKKLESLIGALVKMSRLETGLQDTAVRTESISSTGIQ